MEGFVPRLDEGGLIESEWGWECAGDSRGGRLSAGL